MNKLLISTLLLIIALLIIFTFSLCKKDSSIFTAEAKVYDSGLVAADGCGWLLRVDTTKAYSPLNLSSDFKLNNLDVVIRYRLLDTKFQCGWGNKLQQIELLDIKRKDPNLVIKNAIIVNMGSPQADGCGWMVKVDTAYYSPTNLPDEFKQNNLNIKVGYNLLTTKYQCGIAANLKYTEIALKSIRRN